MAWSVVSAVEVEVVLTQLRSLSGRLAASIVFGTLVAVSLSSSASAQTLKGTISKPGQNRVPIAIVPLAPMSAPDAGIPGEFGRVLGGDLDFSGMFRIIDPAAYIDGVPDGPFAPERLNFLNWQTVGAHYVMMGRYDRAGGEMIVEVALFDVPGRSMLGGRRFRGPANDVARMAHRTADAILEFSTGTPGPFDSRIAFVSNRGGFAKEIFTYTFDGATSKITNHRTVTMAPSWAPNSTDIVFTSFRGGSPSLYSVSIASKAEKKLATKMGLNIGGTWKPDGSALAVAREEGGNTDIYLLHFGSEQQDRLTDHWGIDVDPSWSPDGSRMAFCSSRGGSPQVYVMTPGSKEARRVTFGGSYNCAPVWSPDGQWIAYAGRVGRDFHVFVVPAAGGEARQLTFTGSNEDPTWSPDSRFLTVSREQGGERKLFFISLTGRWERQLTTGRGDDSSPSWSKRLD